MKNVKKIGSVSVVDANINGYTYLCVETAFNRFLYRMIRGRVHFVGKNKTHQTCRLSLASCAISFMEAGARIMVTNEWQEAEEFLKEEKKYF